MYNRMLLEPNYSRNIVPIQEQNRREASAGYVDGKRPSTGPPNIDYIRNYLTPLTRAASGGAPGLAPPPYHP